MVGQGRWHQGPSHLTFTLGRECVSQSCPETGGRPHAAVSSPSRQVCKQTLDVPFTGRLSGSLSTRQVDVGHS